MVFVHNKTILSPMFNRASMILHIEYLPKIQGYLDD